MRSGEDEDWAVAESRNRYKFIIDENAIMLDWFQKHIYVAFQNENKGPVGNSGFPSVL